MRQTPFHSGHVDALRLYGLEKTAVSARLLGTLAGTGLGWATAQPGEGMQGALMGGAGGYAAGAGVSRAWQGARGLGARAAQAYHRLATGGVGQTITQAIPLAMPGLTSTLPPPPQALIQAGPSSLPPQGLLPPASQITKAASDTSLRLGIPGTPLGIGVSDKDVRYEGMRRFVPRDTFERAYSGLAQGLDPQALMELEQEQGTLKHPALGALLGTYALHKLLPSSGATGKLLGGLFGAGGGALYNAATASGRAEDMHEAARGVLMEQTDLQRRAAITGQPTTTANESTPLLVSRGELS